MVEEIAWDLSGIFPTTTSLEIDEAMEMLRNKIPKFSQKYKGKIAAKKSATVVKKILDEFIEIELYGSEIGQYASLSFAANQSLDDTKQLNERVRTFSMEISRDLAFFDVELGKLLLKRPELIGSEKLQEYKHYLEKIQRAAPHNLSETEEKLAISLNRNGVNAWQQFASAHLGSLTFAIEIDGEPQELGFGAALGYLTNENKKIRQQAHKEIFGKLMENGEIFATALRNITSYHVINSELRSFSDTLESSLVMNDIERPMFEGLSTAILEGATHFQNYLRLKAKIMGVKKLDADDISAPVKGLPNMTFTWDEAKDIVISAYSAFDKEFGKMIKSMFDEQHIDAATRLGKRQGAFCSGWAKGKSAFVLLSFTGTLKSVFTLAHELGHAAHAILNENQENLLNQEYPMVIAEVASEFGEMILTDYLLNKVKTDNEKKALLIGLLDNFGQSMFQVFSRTLFEHKTYEAVKNGEYLDAKKFAQLWKTSRDEIHGDVINWNKTMDYDMWTWKPHPYIPGFRYYNYPYVWSQLMVLALYESYQNEGQKFIPKYKAMLAAGGSKSPAELARDMGFDLSDADFWKLGMKQYERVINQLEQLV